jgi:hypothetical protein
MQFMNRPIAVVLAYALLLMPLTYNQRAFAICPDPPGDSSEETQHPEQSNCGDTQWELQANYAGTQFDEGPYYATGVCTGGYSLCNCSRVGPSYRAPTKQFHFDELEDEGGGYYVYDWYWDITVFDGDQGLEGCTSGTCETTGYAGESDPGYVDENEGYDEEEEFCYL